MTEHNPMPDPNVGGASAPSPASTPYPTAQDEERTSVLGEPLPMVDEPITDNADDIEGDNVYMSLTWMNVPKSQAFKIRDAALAGSPDLLSYSVTFSTPINDEGE